MVAMYADVADSTTMQPAPRGGENISTVEVKNVIYRHPDVLEVAVIAVPDEKWGEVAKAFVVPRAGKSS